MKLGLLLFFVFGLQSGLKVADAFTETLTEFPNFLAAEEHNGHQCDHDQFGSAQTAEYTGDLNASRFHTASLYGLLYPISGVNWSRGAMARLSESGSPD